MVAGPELVRQGARSGLEGATSGQAGDHVYKRAAMVQHAFVVTMREEAELGGWSWQQVAEVLPNLS